MPQRIRRHLSFSNVTSLSALVFAMAGTGYAATLAKNSVGSAQIKKGAVANSDLRANAVTSDKVKDAGLLAVDFKAGQLPASAKGAPGANGAVGPEGPQGIQGATGTTGAATVQFEQAAADLADGSSQSYNAFCPAGKQALGGGARGDATDSEQTSVTSSRPAISTGNTEPPIDGGGFTGWRITARNLSGGVVAGIRPEVWVVCA